MTQGRSWHENLRVGIQSENELAIEAMFPPKDKFKMLQMISELNIRAVMPFTVLGVFRRMYKSKVLALFQEEHNLDKIALDRKGRLELSEIVASRKRLEEKGILTKREKRLLNKWGLPRSSSRF